MLKSLGKLFALILGGMVLALVVLYYVSYGTMLANGAIYATGYKNAISQGGIAAELKIEEKRVVYSGRYGRPHYCFIIGVGGSREEVEVSYKTYDGYLAGEFVSCVRTGNTLLVKPILE